MKKKLLLLPALLAAVFCAVFLSSCGEAVKKYNTSVVKLAENGSFGYRTSEDGTVSAQSKFAADWGINAGANLESAARIDFTYDGNNNITSSYLTLAATSTTGYYVGVYQTVDLVPNSYYQVTYEYDSSESFKAVTTETEFRGVFFGIEEDPTFNNPYTSPVGGKTGIVEEQGANQTQNNTVKLFFKTGSNHTYTLSLNVGSPENPVVASAVKISQFDVVRVKASEVEKSQVHPVNYAIFGQTTEYNIIYVVLGGVGTLVLGYVIYMLRARAYALKATNDKAASEGALLVNKRFAKIDGNKFIAPLIIIASVLLVRGLILGIFSGLAAGKFVQIIYYGSEISQRITYAYYLGHTNAFASFFTQYEGAKLLPLEALTVAFAGVIGNTSSTVPFLLITVVLKLFAILADVGTALVIYNIVSKKSGRVSGMLLAVLYGVLPVVFYSAAQIGAVESIAVFFIMLSFKFILDKKYVPAAVSFFAAAMYSPIALLVAPFVLAYTGVYIFRSVQNRDKKWLAPAIVTPLLFLAFFALSMPLYSHFLSDGSGLGGSMFKDYYSMIIGENVYTVNAANFQGLIGNNFRTVTQESTVVTILFVAFIAIVLLGCYLNDRSRLSLLLLAGGFVLTYWYFSNNMTILALLPFIPLTLTYAGLTRDKRIYFITLLLSAMLFTNLAYYCMVTGYSEGYVSTVAGVMSVDALRAISVFNLVSIILMIMSGYSVLISKHVSEHLVLNVSYARYTGNILTNIGVFFTNASRHISAFFKAAFTKNGKSAKK
ncbi:MAG: hypothetical protein LBN25_04570 [Christensenellaceae bacterium]|jgi:hypothetical protein|nr:hypothetical protein [Christensenellaceae bacterium]